MLISDKAREIFNNSQLLYTQQEIEHALDRMATEIHAKLHDKNPVVLCVMIGGMIPMSNLLMRLNREEGATIIIITHDEKIAAQGPRVIKIQDGRLVT